MPDEWVQNDIKLARQARQMRERGYTDEMWDSGMFIFELIIVVFMNLKPCIFDL